MSNLRPLSSTVCACALGLFFTLGACVDRPDDSDDSGGGSATDGASSGGASGDATSTAGNSTGEGPGSTGFGTGATMADEGSESGTEPADPGLWDCDISRACPQLIYHLEPWDEFDAVQCAAELIVSGQPGHISALRSDVVVEIDDWLLIEPDGTALVQTRERECDLADLSCDVTSLPWSNPSGVLRCTMAGTEDLPDECAAETDACAWHPWWDNLVDCVAVDMPTCEELEAALDGSG